VIYFDNAATSFPKPLEVLEAMIHYQQEIGASPGRSGHRLAIEAARAIFAAREMAAEVFHAADPMRVVFTMNVTEALNLALRGLLKPGDHVVTTSMEHNSVMRPLRNLEASGVELSIVNCAPDGSLNILDIENAIRPNTKMLVVNRGSNVTGIVQPVRKIGEIAHQHGILVLTDEAQTGGAFPVDMMKDQVDLLAFTGHKALFGPMGTGGLIIGKRAPLENWIPLKSGGTGSASEKEIQPRFLPDMFESGTPNAIGVAGLLAGMRWINERSIEAIHEHELSLTKHTLEGLCDIPGVIIYASSDVDKQLATFSFNIHGMLPSEVGERLDREYGILCRVGLHCSPAAHHTIGSFPVGTVRFSLGMMNTKQEVDLALRAVKNLAMEAKRR
jgi:cysteine desulfurase family protein